MWSTLKKRYVMANIPKIHKLKASVADCKQGGLDVVEFYSKLFGVEPAKRRPGYANFAVEEPPLKLVLIEGEGDQPTVMDHLGVEVFSTADVDAATRRLTEAGLVTLSEDDTECCYALQDKVWVRGPGAEPWEVYVVKGDADHLERTEDGCRCGIQDGDTEPAPAASSSCC